MKMNYIEATKKANVYRWKNGVECCDFGTVGGATYYIMYKARRKNARSHIWSVWKNCNSSDYMTLKNLLLDPSLINANYDFFIR